MKNKTNTWYQFVSTPMTVVFGGVVGHLSAHYSLWFLLISIPYLFQLTFAIIFKERS